MRVSVTDVRELESAVLGAGGTVLRYGHLYGPGTYYAPDGMIADAVRARGLPLAGEGRGVFSFTHVDDLYRVVHSGVWRFVRPRRVSSGTGSVPGLAFEMPSGLKNWIESG